MHADRLHGRGRDLAILASHFIATVARLLLRWRTIDPAESSAVDSEYVLDFDMFARNEKV
jgi:hypothetical protein